MKDGHIIKSKKNKELSIIDVLSLRNFKNKISFDLERKKKILETILERRYSFKGKSNIDRRKYLRVEDVQFIKPTYNYVYDLTIEGKHQFNAEGFIVHNTASVVKEEDRLGGFRVEPGAMVLAKDLLFIDELNNLHEEDKPKLQEGMSEQEITINKANLHVTMSVTCGNLAVANPKYGNFRDESKETIQEQFNIPTPILNRFDSVFIIRDYVNEDKDREIAERMILRQGGKLDVEYDIPFLRKFFAYIKQIKEPTIPKETKEYMKTIHAKSRRTINQGVKVNPRYLESLIRMATASAKLRQSKVIERKDVNEAFKILCQSQYNVDESIIISFDTFGKVITPLQEVENNNISKKENPLEDNKYEKEILDELNEENNY